MVVGEIVGLSILAPMVTIVVVQLVRAEIATAIAKEERRIANDARLRLLYGERWYVEKWKREIRRYS